jgi:hypothetical protein
LGPDKKTFVEMITKLFIVWNVSGADQETENKNGDKVPLEKQISFSGSNIKLITNKDKKQKRGNKVADNYEIIV